MSVTRIHAGDSVRHIFVPDCIGTVEELVEDGPRCGMFKVAWGSGDLQSQVSYIGALGLERIVNIYPLTLAAQLESPDALLVIGTNMGGETMVSFRLHPEKDTLATLQAMVMENVGSNARRLKLLLSDGTQLEKCMPEQACGKVFGLVSSV
jgi:hypothetical protein